MPGAAIERCKPLAIEFKGDSKDFSRLAMAVVRGAQFVQTAGVLKHSAMEIDRLFGVRIEPQKRRDARKVFESTHGTISLSVCLAANTRFCLPRAWVAQPFSDFTPRPFDLVPHGMRIYRLAAAGWAIDALN